MQSDLDTAIGDQLGPLTQAAGSEHLMRQLDAVLHRQTPVFDRVEWRGPRAAAVAGHPDEVCPSLDDASGHHGRTRDRHDLDRDAGRRIKLMELIDDGIEILNTVNILIIIGGLQLRPDRDVAHFRNNRDDLTAREQAAHTRFGPLGDLDIDHPALPEVGGGHEANWWLWSLASSPLGRGVKR